MATTTRPTVSATEGSRHKTAASLDTNASAIAESTISIGQIGHFPAPPTSIPNSPITSSFPATTRQLPIPPRVPRLQPTPRKLPYPPTSFVHVPSSHSFVQSSSNPPKSSVVSAHDWHDGASSIASDPANEHLLPNGLSTSFITSLLQENKFKRGSSSTSVALSGISETAYSPGPNAGQYNASPIPPSPTSALMTPYYLDNFAGGRPTTPGTINTFKSGDTLLEKRLYTTCDSDADLKESNSSTAHQRLCPSQDSMATRQPFTGSKSQPGTSVSVRSSSSFLSGITKRLSMRNVFARKQKALPPLPIFPNISLAQQQTYHELEMSSALPDLINRATTLRTMLDNGQRPHSSAGSFDYMSSPDTPLHSSDPQDLNKELFRRSKSGPASRTWNLTSKSGPASRSWNLTSKRKRIFIASLFVLSTWVLVIGLVVGLRKHLGLQNSCPEGNVGSKCNINANCVCTSTGQCNGLAQAVIDLLPFMNSAFNENYTAALAYSSFWLMEGGSQGNNCAAQAVILDVGDGLDQTNFPNRTQWAQTALLWNALQTQDLAAALQLQKFVQSLPWSTLIGPDGPVNNAESTSFSITVSGYTFNFASQTVTQPPGTFVTLGQPSEAQIQKVSSTALAALDRMYTYAQASSTQQQAALQKYWTSVLLQRADTLPIFKTALIASPLILPFNASSQAIRNLYPSAISVSPFPPPLSCFPNLDPIFQHDVSSFETAIFGLPSLSSQTGFNKSCYSDRPIYGGLVVLQLRLPFRDDTPSVTQYGAVLSSNSSSRVVFSVGKGFSGIFNGTVNLTPSQLDPRRYGTANFLDHVILQYLSSISDINVANALINFVLESSNAVRAVPPVPSSALYQAIMTLPTIEMAVFGDVMPNDFSSIVSPFTTNSGSLFFGSDDGAALRNWTIGTAQLPLVWTQNATSSLVVRDTSLADNPVTRTWNSVSVALSRGMTNIGLVNITNPLMGNQSFSS